jgi:hypothetical protein
VEKENISFGPKDHGPWGRGRAGAVKTKNKNTDIARDLRVKMRENFCFGGQKNTVCFFSSEVK